MGERVWDWFMTIMLFIVLSAPAWYLIVKSFNE